VDTLDLLLIEEYNSSSLEQENVWCRSVLSFMAEKNPHAVALGSLGGKKRAEVLSAEERKSIGQEGGKKGGPARALKLSKERRSEIARKAVTARWAKKESQ
jgi:hypothetical protein